MPTTCAETRMHTCGIRSQVKTRRFTETQRRRARRLGTVCCSMSAAMAEVKGLRLSVALIGVALMTPAAPARAFPQARPAHTVAGRAGQPRRPVTLEGRVVAVRRLSREVMVQTFQSVHRVAVEPYTRIEAPSASGWS